MMSPLVINIFMNYSTGCWEANNYHLLNKEYFSVIFLQGYFLFSLISITPHSQINTSSLHFLPIQRTLYLFFLQGAL